MLAHGGSLYSFLSGIQLKNFRTKNCFFEPILPRTLFYKRIRFSEFLLIIFANILPPPVYFTLKILISRRLSQKDGPSRGFWQHDKWVTHLGLLLHTVPAITSVFTKKTHKLYLAMGSWLDVLMTQADSVSANTNQVWGCRQLSGAAEVLRRNKAGTRSGRKATHTARPLDAGSIFNMGWTRSHIYLNWYDMFLGGETSQAQTFLRTELLLRTHLLIKPASQQESTSLGPQWQQGISSKSGAVGKCLRAFIEDKEDVRLAFFGRAEERARRCREAGLLMETSRTLGSFMPYDGFSSYGNRL